MIPHADNCTCPDCIRIVAFGAIRRAAAVAREREAQGDDLWHRGFPHFAHPQYNKARDIRRAIRAAIKSGKTPE
jgi:hypothetical protein